MSAKKFAKTDKFGNDFINVAMLDKKESGYAKGYAEIKGTMYQFTYNAAENLADRKTGESFEGGYLRITKMKPATARKSF